MIRAHSIGDSSVFLGQNCALCKQEFGLGDEIVVCPADGSRHHVHCWQANSNKCTAYGCQGEGEIGEATFPPRPQPVRERPVRERPRNRPRVINQEPERPSPRSTARPIPNAPGSKVRTLPAGGIGCARTCLFFAIVAIIVLLVFGCFSIWNFAEYLRQEFLQISMHDLVSTVRVLTQTYLL
jgi:hypothetical protein